MSDDTRLDAQTVWEIAKRCRYAAMYRFRKSKGEQERRSYDEYVGLFHFYMKLERLARRLERKPQRKTT